MTTCGVKVLPHDVAWGDPSGQGAIDALQFARQKCWKINSLRLGLIFGERERGSKFRSPHAALRSAFCSVRMPPQGRLEIDADRLTALQGSGVSALECAFGQLRGCSQLRTSQVADPPFIPECMNRIPLQFPGFGAMHVITRATAGKEMSIMPKFTIDSDDHIETATSELRAEEADHFSDLDELRQVAAQWPASRLVHLWNGLPGVTPGQTLHRSQDRTGPHLEGA